MRKLLQLLTSTFLIVTYLCVPVLALEEEPPVTHH